MDRTERREASNLQVASLEFTATRNFNPRFLWEKAMNPTHFVIFATDAPGKQAVRATVREAHRAYIRQSNADDTVVVFGGPTLAEDQAMNGTLLVVQAASIDAVRRFVADDPYSQNGLFAVVEIREWRCGLVRADLLSS
jgi:uncharacterized protein YciI